MIRDSTSRIFLERDFRSPSWLGALVNLHRGRSLDPYGPESGRSKFAQSGHARTAPQHTRVPTFLRLPVSLLPSGVSRAGAGWLVATVEKSAATRIEQTMVTMLVRRRSLEHAVRGMPRCLSKRFFSSRRKRNARSKGIFASCQTLFYDLHVEIQWKKKNPPFSA